MLKRVYCIVRAGDCTARLPIVHEAIPAEYLLLLDEVKVGAMSHRTKGWEFATSVLEAYYLAPFADELKLVAYEVVHPYIA